MSTLPFALYNPALLPARVLLDEFTARRPMLETLLGVVRGNLRETPPQHCLLIGTRGMGKTTTLWAIAHRVNEDPDLSREWQPVVFDEESRRVGDLADFWLEAIRQWEVATGNDNNQAGHLLSEAAGDIEVQALQAFTQLVKQSGKRALLLIDNLNDLLASIHDSEPLHRLRAHLMHASDLMIIGGATCHFDQVTSIDQPFYDFFRIFELKPLTLEEMRACLTGLAKARGDRDVEEALQQRGGSIQALHLFTGGNPRLVKTFYRLLREGLNQDIRADLERLLDEFTPYFKAIVDALPAQQQRIFDAVALAWDPVEVSRIATATRLPSNQVSAQLRALSKAGLIREASGLPKRKSYLLQDRFSNIHYLMRHGRAARNRLDWFVATVQTLFPNHRATDVLAQIARDAAESGDQGIEDARHLIESALQLLKTEEERKRLTQSALRQSWDRKAMDSLDQWFETVKGTEALPEFEIIAFCKSMPLELRKKIGYAPDQAMWWYEISKFLETKEAWNLTEAAYRKAIELEPDNSNLWALFGEFLRARSGKGSDAESALRKATQLNPDNEFAWALMGLTIAQNEDRLHEALAAAHKATELNPNVPLFWWIVAQCLEGQPSRESEVESAYEAAVRCEPENSFFKTKLAELLSRTPSKTTEARTHVTAALRTDPSSAFTRSVYLRVGGDDPVGWSNVLPHLVSWCRAHPGSKDVFDFTLDGFLRLARLTDPARSLSLLESVPDAEPFETLRDALKARLDRDHLHRLAPERQAVAIELIKRLQPAT